MLAENSPFTCPGISSLSALIAALAFMTAILSVGFGMSLAQTPQDPKTSQGQDAKAVECIASGHQALEKGDLKEATKIFEGCSQKFPTSSLTRYWLGMSYFFAHETEKAINEFKEVVKLDPDNPLGTAMLGRMYSFEQSKLSLAKELLERALSIKPDMDDARFDLARVYAQQQDLEKSFKEFAAIFEGEQRYALYHTEFAKILNAVGEKAEAKKQIDKALAIAPDFEPARQVLTEIIKDEAKSPKLPSEKK
jgi:tetratricopeptide (TPR) repeat protein